MTPAADRAAATPLYILAVACLALAACRAGDDAASAGERLARRWLAAMNEHSVERVLGLFAPGGVHEDPLSGPLSGMKQRAGLFQLWSSIPDLSYAERKVSGDESIVFLEWTASGRHVSGQRLEWAGTTVMEIDGGRIARARSYYDSKVFLPLLPRRGAP